MRLQDLAKDDSQLEGNLLHLLTEIRSASARMSVPLLFCLCPSMASRSFAAGVETRCNALIEAALEEVPGVHFLSLEDVHHLYPVANPHSVEGERLGGIPYTDEYFVALGTAVVRHVHALVAPPCKVIALDCDNTLWNGICGEDGPHAVTLDPARRFLQDFLIDQNESGMLLTLASKNNEEDVLETFRVHPEFPLQLKHIAASRLNWEAKPGNLSSLAAQLSLGLESFIFIDDNLKECAEVQQALPEVLTLALPEPINGTASFLKHVWAFDHPVVTEEDRNRSAYYQQEEQFGAEVRQAASLQQFMDSLQLEVSIAKLVPEKLPRVAQLTQRTNQFNFTTIRRTEAEIAAWVQQPGCECFTIEVADRFGHYGLTGVLLFKDSGNALTVDTFLLSCRVLGRGVEHRVVAWLGERARSRDVLLPLVPTAKNLPASQFLKSVPAFHESRARGIELQEVRWSAPVIAATPAKRSGRAAHPRRTVDYADIARKLATPAQILAAMRSSAASFDPTMSETEKKLARIWAELLERPSISLTDNFFDLGGHSLLAVLLLLRIKETFDVDLSIDDVYSGTLTLADLAASVESASLGGIDPDEYAAMLAEIESMSDEEARMLLESEGR